MPYSATLAVAISPSLWSCQDENNPVQGSVNRSYRTENHQLVRPVLDDGLAALQVELNEVKVELFGSKEQHMMQLHCLRYIPEIDGVVLC